jgi:hypothetical protein
LLETFKVHLKGENMKAVRTVVSRALLTFALGLLWPPAHAAPPACEEDEVKKIPAKAKTIATSVITADAPSWDNSFTAGQAAWLILRNKGTFATPLDVQFTQKAVDPPATKIECASRVVVLPLMTVVVKHTVFGGKVGYNVAVTLPNEPPIDSALVEVTVKALPAP